MDGLTKSQEPAVAVEQQIRQLYDGLVQTSLFDDDTFIVDDMQRERVMQHKREKLDEAEAILSYIMNEKKTSWVETYKVLKVVDEHKLYEAEYRSFSAWLTGYGKRAGISTPQLWKYLSCGRYYDKISEAKESHGGRLNVDPTALSPENVALISKITRGNTQKALQLMRQTADGKIGRTKLKKMWSVERAAKESHGEKAVLANGYERDKQARAQAHATTAMTAGDIVAALDNHSWLPHVVDQKPPHCKKQYLCIPEFPVRTPGTTRHIDDLIVENLTISAADTNFKVVLHGVEIKVSVSDLERDVKMQEYLPFVDDFYIAIPFDDVDLFSAAQEKVDENPGYGLLRIKRDCSVIVSVPAIKTENNGELREETLMTIVTRTKLK